ncbi:sister chromatid cohesion 1 protein 3 isoform X2 [Silene latifolia]|uniref:sister chromatid cohesion 1 protein 3 isoform X2 n=1 Tax=Silene latifolia TaxID=37657 RepID=UPI003D78A1EA
MFYSQTYLARKGPLGTVWCAAHLQHRLKKSHYASTDISSTVERIIYPEVPIALRMYGHLLLGVVRIYSKKVEYLHHDCNVLWVSLRNAFRATDVNLPENATQAQFNAVTLPENFALDAVDIDDQSLFDGSPDNHLRNLDEITLRDQYPENPQLYVRITFDDEIIPDASNSGASLNGGTETTMQIDPRVPDSLAHDINDPFPNPFEEDREIMRDHTDADFHMSTPVLRPHVETATVEPNMSPLRDATEKLIGTPPSARILTPRIPTPHGSGPSSPPTDRALVESDTFVAARSTDLVVRPSPSPERPQPRQRKRKQLFDETLVLNNTFIKKALSDPSDLVKKRKKLPTSALDMWRHNNNKKKEEVFLDPLISGMCTSLVNISSLDLTVLNPNLLRSEQVQPDSRAAESREPGPNFTDETEILRSPDGDPGHNFRDAFSSPLRSPTQVLENVEIPTSPRIPSMVTEPRFESTANTQSDQGTFTRSTDFEMDTPFMNFGETSDQLNTELSDIPEWRNSRESDDLFFLEQDSSPSDSQGSRQGDTMSVRTRAVAQYLKDHSPLSKVSESPPEDLRLNAILEGRRRKLCARMFYETLVLKDRGLIDVKQDEPYGDITLKLTPSFSMAKF